MTEDIREEIKELKAEEMIEKKILQSQININRQLQESEAAMSEILLVLIRHLGPDIQKALTANQEFKYKFALMANNDKISNELREQLAELHKI